MPALSRSRDAVLDELGALARKMDPEPLSAVVFGSFARGEADAASDLDIVRRIIWVARRLLGAQSS